jgi:hypothetical protein
MSTMNIGTKLVELVRQGKNHEATETLYSLDVSSVEARPGPDGKAEVQGLKAVLAKSQWWADNNTIHSASCEGPWPHGDQFIVRFTYDVTFKPTNTRMKLDEMGLFTVSNGKIVREVFFYPS